MTKPDEHAKITRLLILMRLLKSKRSSMTIHDLIVRLVLPTRSVHRYLSTLRKIEINTKRYIIIEETNLHKERNTL